MNTDHLSTIAAAILIKNEGFGDGQMKRDYKNVPKFRHYRINRLQEKPKGLTAILLQNLNGGKSNLLNKKLLIGFITTHQYLSNHLFSLPFSPRYIRLKKNLLLLNIQLILLRLSSCCYHRNQNTRKTYRLQHRKGTARQLHPCTALRNTKSSWSQLPTSILWECIRNIKDNERAIY